MKWGWQMTGESRYGSTFVGRASSWVTSMMIGSYFHEGTLSEQLPLREARLLVPGSQHHPFCCPVPEVEKCEAAGEMKPGILLLICLTTLLAWVQSHSFSFTWSANWNPYLPSLSPCLEALCCWPWIFHSKYTLGAKNDWKKKTTWEQLLSRYLACKAPGTWWNRYSQVSPKDSDLIAGLVALKICMFISGKKLHF